MKRLFKVRPEKGGLACEEASVRKPAYGEVLLKIKAAAICGTDIHIYEWNRWAAQKYCNNLPLPLGHEFCGEVVELGEGVHNFRIGDRVAAETHLNCGTCSQCRQGRPHTCKQLILFSKCGAGCFSEYTTVPAGYLFPVPNAVSDEEGAVLEPLGVAVRAVDDAGVSGKTVLILGCGPIGLLAVTVAKALGAIKILAADTAPYRLALAAQLGADRVVNTKECSLPEAILEWTENEGVHSVIEFTGNPAAIKDGFKCLQNGGKYVMIGLPSTSVEVDIAGDIVTREIEMKGNYGRLIPQTWYLTANLLTSQKINVRKVITHTFRLDEFDQAFGLALSKNSGKILFKFG